MNTNYKIRKLIGQFGRFGIIGILATGVHVSVAFALHYGIGLAPLIANLIAYLLAWGISYAGHFNWTFESNSSHRAAMARFAVVSASAFAINQIIVWSVTVKLGQPFALAIFLAVLIIPATSFVVSKFWTFRHV